MKYFLLALMLLGAAVTVKSATLEGVPRPRTSVRSSGGVRFSDVQLKTGVRLRYAEQGNPKGQPVILLHGYSDSWFSYSRILPLIDKKYHVYVPDQRGHGDSDRPASGYTFPDFAVDVIAFMDPDECGLSTGAGTVHGPGDSAEFESRNDPRATALWY